MAEGDRFSDDVEDRIEWQVDRIRVWVRSGVVMLATCIAWAVLVRVF